MASLPSLPGVAVVTGAGGRGIGAAVAKSFARAGCSRIAITDISKTSLHNTRTALLAMNPSIRIYEEVGDIGSAKFVESFTDAVFDRFGRLDYAVNCAGIMGTDHLDMHQPVDEMKAVEMPIRGHDRILSVNYRGTWLSCRAQLRNMLRQQPLEEHPKQRGAIVNMAGQLGLVARPGAAAYCASKAAIINMTRANAIDYSENMIRVNCVCPGLIKTPMATGTKRMAAALARSMHIAPMKRMGMPNEVADAVMFLCSPQASFIQGHALVVDGGYTIN